MVNKEHPTRMASKGPIGIAYPVALLAVLLRAGDLVVDDPEEVGVDGGGGARLRSGEGRKESWALGTAEMGIGSAEPADPCREEGPCSRRCPWRAAEVGGDGHPGARRFCEGEGSRGEPRTASCCSPEKQAVVGPFGLSNYTICP